MVLSFQRKSAKRTSRGIHRKHFSARMSRTFCWRPRLEILEDRTLLDALTWRAAVSGDWDVPGNWDANRVPTASDTASIPFSGITVTHGMAINDSVQSITSQAALDLSRGSLNVSGNVQVTGTFTLSGATLANATVVAGTTLRTTNTGGTLNRVTFNGDLDLTTVSNANVTVTGDLTLNGTAGLGNSSGSTWGILRFIGNQTLDGSGSVVFGGAGGGTNSLNIQGVSTAACAAENDASATVQGLVADESQNAPRGAAAVAQAGRAIERQVARDRHVSVTDRGQVQIAVKGHPIECAAGVRRSKSRTGHDGCIGERCSR